MLSLFIYYLLKCLTNDCYLPVENLSKKFKFELETYQFWFDFNNDVLLKLCNFIRNLYDILTNCLQFDQLKIFKEIHLSLKLIRCALILRMMFLLVIWQISNKNLELKTYQLWFTVITTGLASWFTSLHSMYYIGYDHVKACSIFHLA